MTGKRYREEVYGVMKKQRALGDSSGIRVLLYHRILQGAADSDWANVGTSIEAFKKQMELLDTWGYTAITLHDYMLYHNGELDLPKKPVIITFDDAYKEIYDVVFPILKSYGMKAVLFIVADRSITRSEWDRDSGEMYQLLDQYQILELRAAGFEIGSHTISHPRLTLMPENVAREELTRSRMLLEMFLNAPVMSFAYPFGLINNNIKQLVKEAGYTTACASYSGPPLFGEDLYEIRRIKTSNSTNAFVFWFQLQTVNLMYRWMRWLIKKYLIDIFAKQTISAYDQEIIDHSMKNTTEEKEKESRVIR
jgi:peptidoglycan/xylan/chitin deacetylase (PgdA/CDA1 family)